MWPLKLFRLCPKTAAMQAIVNDVLQERAHFTSCDSTCSMFLPLLISHHFNSQYVSNCLHIIPSHLRPSYNTCSTHSCCSALLHHIQVQISYFASLSQSEFLSIFLSVFPYDEHSSPHKLTERMATHHTLNTNIASTSKTDVPMDVM